MSSVGEVDSEFEKDSVILPPSHYNESFSSYHTQWQQYKKNFFNSSEQQQKRLIIFDLIWIEKSYMSIGNNDISNSADYEESQYLVGCTNRGEIAVWNVPTYSNAMGDMTPTSQKPIYRRIISNNILYSIHVSTISNEDGKKQVLLFVSGEEGVFVLDWKKDIYDHMKTKDYLPEKAPLESSNKRRKMNSATKLGKSNTCEEEETEKSNFLTFVSLPTVYYKCPIIDVKVQKENGKYYVYGAAKDTFCYKWDLHTKELLTTYPCKRLQRIEIIDRYYDDTENHIRQISTNIKGKDDDNDDDMIAHNSDSYRESKYLLLVGNTIQVWNININQRIDEVHLPLTSSDASSSNKNGYPGYYKNNYTITSFLVKDEYWWTISGSFNNQGGSTSMGNNGGFIATYHVHTKSWIAFTETRETIKKLKFLSSTSVSETGGGNNASCHSGDILSVANEGVISHWNPFTLKRVRRVWCSPPCVYSIASTVLSSISSTSGMKGITADVGDDNAIEPNKKLFIVAVAGVGGSIDLLESGQTHNRRLHYY